MKHLKVFEMEEELILAYCLYCQATAPVTHINSYPKLHHFIAYCQALAPDILTPYSLTKATLFTTIYA